MTKLFLYDFNHLFIFKHWTKFGELSKMKFFILRVYKYVYHLKINYFILIIYLEFISPLKRTRSRGELIHKYKIDNGLDVINWYKQLILRLQRVSSIRLGVKRCFLVWKIKFRIRKFFGRLDVIDKFPTWDFGTSQ